MVERYLRKVNEKAKVVGSHKIYNTRNIHREAQERVFRRVMDGDLVINLNMLMICFTSLAGRLPTIYRESLKTTANINSCVVFG